MSIYVGNKKVSGSGVQIDSSLSDTSQRPVTNQAVTKALQDLIVTMIACSFMLCIDLAVVKALFQWDKSVFVVAAGGSSYSNLPQAANTAMAFGEHSVTWLSALLTFYLFFKIFDMTQQQLKNYTGSGMDGLYKSVKSDSKTLYGGIKNIGKQLGTAIGWIKK